MREFKSLYVHCPFCLKKCPYCDFYSVESKLEEKSYLKALLKELSLESPEFSQFPTVYFGGGTPSLLSPAFFEAVLAKVGQFSEVTVEFNPEDAEGEKLRALREVGVNRISLGIQSLSEETLKRLGRRQGVKENLKALEETLKYFPNASVDLIFGAPGQKAEEFLRELSFLVENFPVKHLSLYALTLYPETPFYALASKGRLELPPEEEVERAYYGAVELLKEKGFNHYEISNFALPGFESKHNLNYWKLENYLGVGPSAASFKEKRFWKKRAELKEYLEALERGELPLEEEVEFSPEELLEVKVQMGMRLTEGVEVSLLPEKALENPRVKELIDEGFLEVEGGRLKLGRKGLFVSNSVIGELLATF